jgi:hypothetical protein
MLNLNCTILADVVEQALVDAAAHPRWVSAIRRAFEEVDSNPYMERNPSGHGLIIGSSSGTAYSANGVCSCEAFQYGNACWHRAAARLVRRHDEALARARLVDCSEPDNGCSIDDPCIAHIEIAAAQRGPQSPLGERLAAARKATALVNELFA